MVRPRRTSNSHHGINVLLIGVESFGEGVVVQLSVRSRIGDLVMTVWVQCSNHYLALSAIIAVGYLASLQLAKGHSGVVHSNYGYQNIIYFAK